MDSRIRFQRTFLIFNAEDKGFGSGQEPTGYAKIEVTDGKGRLTASIQNLKEIEQLDYKLYILKCSNEKVSAVPLGPIALQRSKAEAKWDFDPNNVFGSGLNIKDLNVVAVIGKRKDGRGNEVVCPLAAYRDGKVSWRSKFRDVIGPDKVADKNPAVPSKVADYERIAEENHQVKASKDKESIETVQLRESSEGKAPDRDILSKYEGGIDNRYTPTANTPQIESIFVEEERQQEIHDQIHLQKDENLEPMFTDENLYNKGLKNDIENSVQRANSLENDLSILKKEEKEGVKKYSDAGYNEFSEMARSLGINNIGDMAQGNGLPFNHMNTSFCIPHTGDSPSNPCNKCAMNNARKSVNNNLLKEEGDTQSLRAYFDKYFEVFDPFRSRRRDYNWWKVGSPVQLNNIMYQCNIKTPLLFNPAVMMAHFKYRYLIVGIYTDKVRKREYVVCGVPGVFRVDDKPFGDMCRWVQVEGNKPRQGAFGYWLVYIDGKSGKMLNIN